MYENQLSSLQGTVVPVFYGLYETVHEGDTLGCLVLEDCGEPPAVIFPYLPVATRLTILRKLQEIHRCGIIHEDFRVPNVLLRGRDVRIIDFGRVSPHKGECKMEIRRDLTPWEHVIDVDCEDIYCYCEDFQIWSKNVTIGQSVFPPDGLPPQEAVDELISRRRTRFDNEDQRRMLFGRLREVSIELEKGIPIEDIKWDIVFIAGRPIRPASDYPPQEFIDSVLRRLSVYEGTDGTPQQVESILHILREAKLPLSDGSVTSEEVEAKVREALHFTNRDRVLHRTSIASH
ncbi:hypothetical protein GLOTRDRAFT_127060 [Gloeophyllum trabeum ATCC 11539]|uniref:Protein kinase domain-containing protein n=1 Tax=Gloeophyllum trabeum (strain ATCC 11539 / FP-39264 / Madison 617) TaxID=670483 RepID=S7QHC7_GLOTA|nr:uncharacterized protein GLOTRDRAFT_127060 [Gloeophyllum trabeum ATCC 11539]EPQ58562.1 hypothetical protein GLOTRDRAFT_127060 [Gloeophyllum trabeum ATCC 11539]